MFWKKKQKPEIIVDSSEFSDILKGELIESVKSLEGLVYELNQKLQTLEAKQGLLEEKIDSEIMMHLADVYKHLILTQTLNEEMKLMLININKQVYNTIETLKQRGIDVEDIKINFN